MLTLYQCKPTFQNRLRPLVKRLAHLGVTPNQVTMMALVLSLGMGATTAIFVTSPVLPALLLALPWVLCLRMALNAIDGMLARDYHMTSNLGGLLNEVGDVVSDLALFLPFSLMPGMSAPWIVAIAILATLTEFVGVLAWAIAQQRCYAGPMGKSDRALVFGILGLGLGLDLKIKAWLPWLWLGVVLLQLLTIVNRIRITLATLESC